MSAELSTSQQMDGSVVPLGTKNGIELAILRRSKKTMGKVIGIPDSPDLIVELTRLGEGDRRIQVSFTLTYPGIIKAIHYHAEQTDLWVPISGMVQVFLYDLRRNSKTLGLINTIFVGSYRPWEILIPPGVGHGYKAPGVEPIQLLYFTDRHYNPADEFRITYNDPRIAYDWEAQHK
jgi:dTDP-4-dehydrorhamnose 3,5-epimerase